MKGKSLRQISRVLTKNSASILTGLGIAGFISTVGLAIKATPIASEIIAREDYELYTRDGGELSKKDILRLTWKCYIPTAIMGGISIGCIIGANSINLKRNAALAGLYSLSEKTLKEYQAKVVETIGDKKEHKVREDIERDKILKNPPKDNEIILTGRGEVDCWDAFSGRPFRSDIESIRRDINDLNSDMNNGDDFISLNELYFKLGLDAVESGEYLGWYRDDGLLQLDPSSVLVDGRPYLSVSFKTRPRYIYDD
jgi:hypothetical protein